MVAIALWPLVWEIWGEEGRCFEDHSQSKGEVRMGNYVLLRLCGFLDLYNNSLASSLLHPSVDHCSRKCENGDCQPNRLLHSPWGYSLMNPWAARSKETLEGLSVSLYLASIILLSFLAVISIIYRPPVVDSCLSAYSMTFKHFINEFYRESASDGRCHKKQALWVGLGAVLFICASCTMNCCEEWVFILKVWGQKYKQIFPSYLISTKLHALSLIIRQCCLMAGSSSLLFMAQETGMQREHSLLWLEGNLLFRLFGLSSLPLSSACLTSVSQSFSKPVLWLFSV